MDAETKGDWVVRVRRVLVETVYCVDCTEAEAKANPYDYHSDVIEDDDDEKWDVISVERDTDDDD